MNMVADVWMRVAAALDVIKQGKKVRLLLVIARLGKIPAAASAVEFCTKERAEIVPDWKGLWKDGHVHLFAVLISLFLIIHELESINEIRISILEHIWCIIDEDTRPALLRFWSFAISISMHLSIFYVFYPDYFASFF